MIQQTQYVLMVLLLGVCVFSACSSSHSEDSSDLPIPEAAPLSVESTTPVKTEPSKSEYKEFDGFRFRVPAGWQQVELSPAQQGFITASFQIPQAGDGVKLTLSSVGGGVDANLKRWVGQFQLPPGETPRQESIRVDSIDAVWLDLRGTFNSGTALDSNVESGMRMIGVAIPRSPRDFYLKLTGPREQLLKAEKEFRDFVKSARIVP